MNQITTVLIPAGQTAAQINAAVNAVIAAPPPNTVYFCMAVSPYNPDGMAIIIQFAPAR